MSNLASRLAVATVGVPVVLGALYLGGWWLFALLARARAVALHEFWLLARALRPLALAGYVGGLLALLGAHGGGAAWMVGGVLTAFALAFALKGFSGSRQASTTSISATVMGAVWIGCGLSFVLLLRALPLHGRLAATTVLLAIWAGDTLAYAGGRLVGSHAMAPSTSPGKTWEGFVFGSAATVFVAFVALYKAHFLTVTESLLLGAAIAVAAPLGDLFESMLKRDAGVKDAGWLLGRPRRPARPHRRHPFRGARGVLLHPGLRLPLSGRAARAPATLDRDEADRAAGRDRLDRPPGARGDRGQPRARARRRDLGVGRPIDGLAPLTQTGGDPVGLLERAAPDVVLNAVVGFAGLAPTMWALEHGVTLALANKESLVAAGELALEARSRGARRADPGRQRALGAFPVRAAGRAGERRADRQRRALPRKRREELTEVTPAEALAHPTWSMGPKITIDSATLANKGLEVIEAHFLFGLAYDRIEVVIHPPSLVHGLVRFRDGAAIAHLGHPDMRVPISYALNYPERAATPVAPLALRTLEFFEPDLDTFPLLQLAREAGERGGTYPCAYNAANEVAVAGVPGGADRLPRYRRRRRRGARARRRLAGARP